MNGQRFSHPIPIRIGTQSFKLEDVRREDKDAVLRLFVSAFGYTPHERWFPWKYAPGRGEAVGLWDEKGRLIAHYGGFARELRWKGVSVSAIQVGDVMVAPEVRGLSARKGPFYHVASHFLSSRAGVDRPYRIAFGFPNERHIRLGVALGLYRNFGPIYQLRWRTDHHKLPFAWRWSFLPPDTKDCERDVTRAWKAMERDMGLFVLGVRDAEYLRHRFLSRPDREYTFLSIKRWPWGESKAICVMGLHGKQAELLDVIGPRRAMHLAVRAALSAAASSGADVLTCWGTPAVFRVLQRTGAERTVNAAFLALSRVTAIPEEDIEGSEWWLMGGDTDFL